MVDVCGLVVGRVLCLHAPAAPGTPNCDDGRGRAAERSPSPRAACWARNQDELEAAALLLPSLGKRGADSRWKCA